MLIHLAIWGAALPAQAADSSIPEEAKDADSAAAKNEETMVAIAARQTLQALAFQRSRLTKYANTRRHAISPELIRTQPGVNLTGNSTSGQRGNNRQIDIRGMGPENTLILIDGKPVTSRNSVRYGWRGDRDTRGDTGLGSRGDDRPH